MSERALGFYEFFAGGGMARIALGSRWKCLFANELCEKKVQAYRLNFGPSPELNVGNVWDLAAANLPPNALLSWASFPCQDLSLAGNGNGLRGERSGTFVAFWKLMDDVNKQGRGVPLVVLENVGGALTSNGGRDFEAILQHVVRSGYRIGAVVIDGVRFVPQSRARVFFVAVRSEVEIPQRLTLDGPSSSWHPRRLCAAQAALPETLKEAWIWWKLPEPSRMTTQMTDVIEDDPQDVKWHTPDETRQLLSLMSDSHLRKVQKAQAYGRKIVGTVYKRIRPGENGIKTQRAEVRFDQISGCLRTPTGGSSRQFILAVEGESIRSRLLSPREAARLMGLPETYRLPPKYNDAYHVAGDGLVIPAVAWLENHLLSPLALSISSPEYKVA